MRRGEPFYIEVTTAMLDRIYRVAGRASLATYDYRNQQKATAHEREAELVREWRKTARTVAAAPRPLPGEEKE